MGVLGVVACLVENLGGEIWDILGMNRVAVARNGLKLWENGAGRFRKAMGWLPELLDSIKKQKISENGGPRKALSEARIRQNIAALLAWSLEQFHTPAILSRMRRILRAPRMPPTL